MAENIVTVSALSGGYFTLPEHDFVYPATDARQTVPSLCFLIQHASTDNASKTTRIVFDLGLRRDPSKYLASMESHLKTRQPMTTMPDVSASLRRGGLEPRDVDFVILSHVHWDHIGTPSDFTTAQFIVGNGSFDLLRSGGGGAAGKHAHFERDLLPEGRGFEFESLPTGGGATDGSGARKPAGLLSVGPWKSLFNFPDAVDLFGDGSVFVINAPGHLQGHINLLARIGPNKWVYLGGDVCHDRRLLRGECQIAHWTDDSGKLCCFHVDKKQTEMMLERIRTFEKTEGLNVQVVLAHDVEWLHSDGAEACFWPGTF